MFLQRCTVIRWQGILPALARGCVLNFFLGWLILACLVASGCRNRVESPSSVDSNTASDNTASGNAAASASDSPPVGHGSLLDDQRAARDATTWKLEVEAQRYEAYFVNLWDQLRNSDQTEETIASQAFVEIVLPEFAAAEAMDNEVQTASSTVGDTTQHSEWESLVRGFLERVEVVQSEWHHTRFTEAEVGSRSGPQSVVSMTLHLADARDEQRWIVKGDLIVSWKADGSVLPQRIDASKLRYWTKRGPPQFRLAATLPATQRGATSFLAAYDLDGDGLSEIFFGNQVFRNRGNGGFAAERLCRFRTAPLQSAVLCDFNSDGRTDLLCADPGKHPELFYADESGRFPGEPIVIRSAPKITDYSTSITAGDVNGDNLNDVWISQYKPPYRGGQMPTPYYDANDGNSSSLLLNKGNGNFHDATESAGLAKKRKRRTYSSQLVDVDADYDLDLVVISDFAGVDIYENDGTGYFTDITASAISESNSFGMSHTFGDFDGDAELDFYVCGMGSTTARRLEAMKAGPDVSATRMRRVMGYGNRMYLRNGGVFEEPVFANEVARTGWSWGVTQFDFDNDGDRDIFVGNGHISGASAKDYCSTFWRHDIYNGTSENNTGLEQLFLRTQQDFQTRGSWNGFEHNSLLVNRQQKGFVDLSFLFGLAHEFDTRNVVADDIDANGLVDLLIVEHSVGALPKLHVFRNYGSTKNWIGVALRASSKSSLPGTRVIVRTDSNALVEVIGNGDSFNSQHASTVHFGLGEELPKSLEIIWPQGVRHVVAAPKPNAYVFLTRENQQN